MRRLLAIMAIALLGLLAQSAHETRAAPAQAVPPTRAVILLYGWSGNTSSWSTAQAAYVAGGCIAPTCMVYTLGLNGGWSAGDTERNAQTVDNFIAANHLTNVKLDGHSLGGWLALDVALVHRNPAVTSVVLRDTGYGCVYYYQWGIGWVGTPGDQCAGSALLTALAGAPASSVPILNLSHLTDALPQVDCLRVYNLDHSAFQTNAAVNAAAIAWPGVNPCVTPSATPAPTRSPVPTATPCRRGCR